MTAFLYYIGRSGLYLGVFYAFYLLVMRRTTFFQLNRTLLLVGSYLCLALPFIKLRTVSAVGIAEDLTIAAVGTETESIATTSAFPWWELLLALYIAGALVTLALFVVSCWKMESLIRKGEKTQRDGYRLVLLDEDVPSFSWGWTVVMSRKDLAQNPAIFTHELMHVKSRHSLDMILFLPLQLLFWWNPLVWITREELRLLHEYEADEGVIQNGIDATQYQLLLVRKAVGEQRFTLASGFQHAKLKNRITMMLKTSSSRWMRWSYLALIPVLAAFMFACNASRETKDADNTGIADDQIPMTTTIAAPDAPEVDAVPFAEIEVKPTFNGGDANEFSRWVNSQLTYPESAKEDKVQGRVTLQFTVDTDGSVRDVKVLRGLRDDLDDVAIKAISASPKWNPGTRADGTPVPVTYVFPIVFQLR